MAAWVSQVGLIELVDFSHVSTSSVTAYYDAAMIETTGRRDWIAVNLPASASQDAAGALDPVTDAPFETVLTNREMEEAILIQSAPGASWEIQAQIAADAQNAFAAYTASHIETMLAVVVDGRVLITPVIGAEIRETLALAHTLDLGEARRLAALVNSGPLPVALVVDTIEVLE